MYYLTRWFSYCRRLSMLLLLPLLVACPLGPQSREEAEAASKAEPATPAEPPAPEPRGLAVGEQVEFTFAGDGLWHDAPYLAMNADYLEFKPAGQSRALATEAIRFKIDQLPQMLKNGVKFRVTTPGRISFRLDAMYLKEKTPELAVSIRRIE